MKGIITRTVSTFRSKLKSCILLVLVLAAIWVIYYFQHLSHLPSLEKPRSEDPSMAYELFNVLSPYHVLTFVDVPFCSKSDGFLEDLLSSVSSPYNCTGPKHSVTCDRDSKESLPWLVSRYSRARPCGTLPSRSSYAVCPAVWSVPGAKSFIIANLCDPITRFVREFENRDILRRKPFWKRCNDRLIKENVDCYAARNISEFIACYKNPASNRITRMLSSSYCSGTLPLIHHKTSLMYLRSAIMTIDSLNFISFTEFKALSRELFTKIFSPIELRSNSDVFRSQAKEDLALNSYSDEVLKQIIHLNRYDIMLYQYGLQYLRSQAEFYGMEGTFTLDDLEYKNDLIHLTNIPGPYDYESFDYFPEQ